MGRMLGFEEGMSSWRVFALDRLVLGIALALCFGLWATSSSVLVASTRYDGGRSAACKYFTGTRFVERHFGAAAGKGCPLFRVG